jgi:hypothetical protein
MKFVISLFIVVWLLLLGLFTLLASFSLVLLSPSITINGLTIVDAVATCVFYNTQSLTFINGMRLTIPFILLTFIGVLLISVANLVSVIKRQDSPSPISTMISVNLLLTLFIMTIGLTLSSRMQLIGDQLLSFSDVNAVNACTSLDFVEPQIIGGFILEGVSPIRFAIVGITLILSFLTWLLYRQRPSAVELNQYFDTREQCAYCNLLPMKGENMQNDGCLWCHASWKVDNVGIMQSGDTTTDLTIAINLYHTQGVPLFRPQLSIRSNDNFRVRDVMSKANHDDLGWNHVGTENNEWVGALDGTLSGYAMSTTGNIFISLEKRGFMSRRNIDLVLRVRPDNSQQWSQPVSVQYSL